MAIWTKIKFPHIVERLRREFPNESEEWLNKEYRRIARSSNYECLVEKYGKDKADEMKLKASKCRTLEGYIEKYGEVDGPIRYQDLLNRRNGKNSLKDLTELYGEAEARRILDERNSKSQRSKSLEGYIERFGEEEGRLKYEEMRAKRKKANSLEWYQSKYGDDEGLIKYNEFRAKCSRANTLEGMKEKYGDEEGARLYKEMKDRQSFGQTLEGYISQYGPEEGPKRYNEWKAKFGYSHTLQGYIDKFGEEEGTRRYSDAQVKRSESASLDGYVERYGPIEGPKKRQEWIIKSANTLENFIRIYGETEGLKRWDEYKMKIATRVISKSSRISCELFDSISEILVSSYNFNRSDIFYGDNEKGFLIEILGTDKTAIMKPDFYIQSSKKVVEFFGDYWHDNPWTLPESDDGESHSEKWKWDELRIRSMYRSEHVDSVMVVWEKDYKENKEQVVEQLIKFLTDGKN